MGEQTEGRRELVDRIAEAYHRRQYGDNGTYATLTEAAQIAYAILDELGLEQVGWLQDADTDDPAPVKMKHGSAFYAGDVGVCVPVYRLGASLRANGDTQ